MKVPAKAKSESGESAHPDLERFTARLKEGPPEPYSFVTLVGLKTLDPMKIEKQVEKGLPYSALLRFQRGLALSLEQVAEVVSIKPRTLTRRKERGRLQPEESDRLLRASRIFAQALQLFEGDVAAARRWLNSPQISLAGARPLDMIKTDIAAREVENLIGRLEHGIPV